jgi:hypothetical protein
MKKYIKILTTILISDNAIYLHKNFNDLWITMMYNKEPDDGPMGLKHVVL